MGRQGYKGVYMGIQGYTWVLTGANDQEHATPINVTAFLQTDLFLVHLFFCERKAVPVQ